MGQAQQSVVQSPVPGSGTPQGPIFEWSLVLSLGRASQSGRQTDLPSLLTVVRTNANGLTIT